MSKPAKKTAKKPARILAPIRSDETYSLAVVRGLTGWGDAAIRAARKNGLRMLYLHKGVFCSGENLVSYIEQNGKDKPP